jgi:hypothetical protein
MSSLRVPKSHYRNVIQEKWRLCMVGIEKLETIQYSLNFLPISPFYCLIHNKSAFDFQPTCNFNSGYFSLFCMTTNASEPSGCQGRVQKYKRHKRPLFYSTSRTKPFAHFPILFYSPVHPRSPFVSWSHFPWWSNFFFNLPGENQNTVGYARMNVNGSGTSFVIASVRSSVHCNICI